MRTVVRGARLFDQPCRSSYYTAVRAFIIASGPSLTAADSQLVHAWQAPDQFVIAVNLSWRMAPWADYLFAGDAQFWQADTYRQDIAHSFRGTLWTASERAALLYGLGLLLAPLLTNSGANAIQLARQLGADWIGLLGFDYGPGEGGALHWHRDHAEPLTNSGQFEIPQIQRLAMELAAAGIQVVNCSRRTRLECFPRMDLELVV